ncbi:hypothetical protein [Stakelama marina]|uniref:Lipoprotein n=1 Tax=Stakelama marina TaxID=2826939 RepID=A0A8T4IDV1_9SPHN|nr:hypothetical protein [Stakelama marina]MBR0552034.1 hypothetical protein [Stakelama marina]
MLRLPICIAALLSATACFGPHDDPDVTQETRQQIARCGGGIEIQKNLAVQLRFDLGHGGLSAGSRKALRAAIFSQVAPADAPAIYDRYTACITSEKAKDVLLAQILDRKQQFVDMLSGDDRYPASVVQELAQYYQREHDAFAKGELVESRQERSKLVYAFLKYSVEHDIPLGPAPPPPPPSPGWTPPAEMSSAKATYRAPATEICDKMADDLACQAALAKLYDAN